MEDKKVMLINAVPAAAHLREVINFNPRNFIRRETDPETGAVQVRMQLRYKKLWFRLAFPNGSMNYRPIRVTDQLATYEATVYLDRSDERPISAFTATRSRENVPDGDYVRAAQEAALDTALDDAGFGIQLCEVDPAVVEPGPTANPEPAPKPTSSQEKTQAPASSYPSENTSRTAEAQVNSEYKTSVQQAGELAPEHKETTAPQDSGGINAALGLLRSLGGQEGSSDAHPENQSTAKEPEPPDEGPRENFSGSPDKTADSQPEEPEQVKYTNDMTVEDICSQMTPEEAGKLVVSTGVNIGWTIEQIAEKRPSSLKFYAYLDDDCGNVIKAAALIMLDAYNQAKAS